MVAVLVLSHLSSEGRDPSLMVYRSGLHVAAEMVGMPDGALAEYAVVVVSYLNKDGESAFGLTTFGDVPFSAPIGLMMMAQHHLLHQSNPTPCEQDDDDDVPS